MPKLKDAVPVVSQLLGYFSKNKGLNTVTAAVAAPTALVAVDSGQELLLQLFGQEVANYLLSGTTVGWVVGGTIIALRAGLAIFRSKKAK